ncbi:MAG: right-handed parallel beta-helix repeat-containing protein, partial [Acidobacteria bacterium]|nr:right-handed parallel beta-helix repeat-containing protein [Acidobacteriota bacterium]
MPSLIVSAPAPIPATASTSTAGGGTAVPNVGGGDNAPTPATTVSTTVAIHVAPATATLSAGQSQIFAANVSGTSNTAVTWLVSGVAGGNSTVGTISASGLYTAPATPPASSVFLMAVSAADTSKSATASVSFISGTNYYISTTGSDANDGSQTNPWATLQHAASKVAPGTTVHVAAGTYSGAITTNTAGTASQRIRFVSDVQWAAKIRATSVDIVWTNMADYVDIEGFDIAGNDGATCNGIINYASYVRIVGNNVHDVGHDVATCLWGAGIVNHQNRAGHDDDVIGNLVHDVGDYTHPYQYLHGIYQANLRGHVWNNVIYRCEGWGIQLWHAANQVTIANNTIFNNAYGGILIGDGDDPGGFPAGVIDDYTVVTNNIVYQNGLQSGANGYGIEEYGNTGTHNQYSNNLVYQNGPSNWRLQNAVIAVSTITADPQFMNYQANGSGDYKLLPASPAIG